MTFRLFGQKKGERAMSLLGEYADAQDAYSAKMVWQRMGATLLSVRPIMGKPASARGKAMSASWWMRGEDLGILYHGSKHKVERIDPARLQSRDYGYYGDGFYLTATERYAKNYGPRVSRFVFEPGANVLVVTLDPRESDPALVKEVIAHKFEKYIERVRARNREADFLEELDRIALSPLDWSRAADEYGVDHGASTLVAT